MYRELHQQQLSFNSQWGLTCSKRFCIVGSDNYIQILDPQTLQPLSRQFDSRKAGNNWNCDYAILESKLKEEEDDLAIAAVPLTLPRGAVRIVDLIPLLPKNWPPELEEAKRLKQTELPELMTFTNYPFHHDHTVYSTTFIGELVDKKLTGLRLVDCAYTQNGMKSACCLYDLEKQTILCRVATPSIACSVVFVPTSEKRDLLVFPSKGNGDAKPNSLGVLHVFEILSNNSNSTTTTTAEEDGSGVECKDVTAEVFHDKNGDSAPQAAGPRVLAIAPNLEFFASTHIVSANVLQKYNQERRPALQPTCVKIYSADPSTRFECLRTLTVPPCASEEEGEVGGDYAIWSVAISPNSALVALTASVELLPAAETTPSLTLSSFNLTLPSAKQTPEKHNSIYIFAWRTGKLVCKIPPPPSSGAQSELNRVVFASNTRIISQFSNGLCTSYFITSLWDIRKNTVLVREKGSGKLSGCLKSVWNVFVLSTLFSPF